MRTSPKRKALGQHFLHNPEIIKKIIVCIAPTKEDTIIEIGPGKGSLTIPLAQNASKVIAIEKDPTFIPALRDLGFHNLSVLHSDILSVDFKDLIKKDTSKLAGNLPYSISSPILFKVLKSRKLFRSCTFLLQKEVAERLCASSGNKKYAPVSILYENYYDRKIQFFIAPGAFSPPPAVTSALVTLERKDHPGFFIDNDDQFLLFLRICFRHRRKKLINNLKAAEYDLSQITKVFKNMEINETSRAENLSLQQYVRVYDFLMNSSNVV